MAASQSMSGGNRTGPAERSASTQADLESGIGDLLGCRDLFPTLGLSLEPLVFRHRRFELQELSTSLALTLDPGQGAEDVISNDDGSVDVITEPDDLRFDDDLMQAMASSLAVNKWYTTPILNWVL